jgi:hypothetical protein
MRRTPPRKTLLLGLAAAATVLLLCVGLPLALVLGLSDRDKQPSGATTNEGPAIAQTQPRPPSDAAIPVSQPPSAKPDEEKPLSSPSEAKKTPLPDSPGKPTTHPPAPARKPAEFDGWLQNLEQAKRQAAQEQKDILILFDGSDWCGWSMRLAREVLFKDEFRRRAAQTFVLVLVDFPQGPAGKARVEDAARNERLQAHFHIDGYPNVVLADAAGRPYAGTGYQEGGAAAYLEHLAELQQVRFHRDQLFDAVKSAKGADALDAAGQAAEFLSDRDLAGYYSPLLRDWLKLAQKHDPQNEQGYVERFFLADWYEQLQRTAEAGPGELVACVARLHDWRKQYHIKSANLGAFMYCEAGKCLALAQKHTEASRCFRDGLACNPTNPRLQEFLRRAAAGKLELGAGTGFVVAAGGYVLTNHHVVAGPGRLLVQASPDVEPVPAEVVARDEKRDLALLRVKAARLAELKPLRLAAKKPVGRGDKVATLGYPLSDQLGKGLKLVSGTVSGIPEPGTDGMLLLDLRINPGNSGGPLFDTAANVVGLITAKSLTGRATDSYGLARPAADLESFLREHVPAYQAPAPGEQQLEWHQVDRQVSPSVLRVLRLL